MTDTDERVPTGIERVDDVLAGGIVPQTATLVRGAPGAGKTIFALHFLAKGVDAGESTLYINLGEPSDYLQRTATQFGLSVDTVDFLDLSPTAGQFQESTSYDLFEASEVESPDVVEAIRERIDTVEPSRVVIDPVTELRYLSADPRQFRTRILSLLAFLDSVGATVLLTSQAAPSVTDDDLQFLTDAVIDLDIEGERRTISVPKFRGSDVARGPHTITITDDGIAVWPRLSPEKHERETGLGTLASGIDGLDELLGGGLTTGTITFFSGPTGVGKTTLGLQYLAGAAADGDRAVLYSFEEAEKTILKRADALGIPARELVTDGVLSIEVIDPGEITADEFTHRLRGAVETEKAAVLMIDGVNGYGRILDGVDNGGIDHLLRTGRYLRNMGVTTIVTDEVHGITGDVHATEQQLSHLADALLVLRHVEHDGELRKVIAALKNRVGECSRAIHELQISSEGVSIGSPLSGMRGILTGTPNWDDDE